MKMEKLKTAEDRKARKPLLERKRRARINESLTELKEIVLRSRNKDSSRYTKMEKADILEMAVRHLKALRETVNSFSTTESALQYRNGYKHCATEVSHYVTSMDSMDHNVRSDILCHLNSCCQSVYMSFPCSTSSPPMSPLLQSRPPVDPHHYPFQPVPYPPPSLLMHAHARQQQTGSDVTHLIKVPEYHTTKQYSMNTARSSGETLGNTAKETSRPEPVWRPWQQSP